MIITVKNLQQESFTIDIDDTNTVLKLKEKIRQEKGVDYPVEYQKLIYAGKILSDESVLKEYNIEKSKFIVVMVSKPKISSSATASTSKATVAESKPSEAPATTATKDEKEKPSTAAAAAAAVASASSESKQTPTTAESAIATSALLQTPSITPQESIVQSIVDIGYERAAVVRALKASFNDPDRAVEYLINGIPSDVGETDDQIVTPPTTRESSTENPLNFLRNQPQFNQMRQIVQQNPNLLNAVLQQVGQTNPELLQLISQNQEAFIRLMNEREPEQSSESGGPDLLNESPAVSALSGLAVPVTQEDKEAIERLKALGYPEHLVIQAYFACDKNENLAANFLLSQNLDD